MCLEFGQPISKAFVYGNTSGFLIVRRRLFSSPENEELAHWLLAVRLVKNMLRTWSQTWSSPGSFFVAALGHLFPSLQYMGYVPMYTMYQVHWLLPAQVFPSVASGKDSELKANRVPFFSLEINSREILSSYPRRPVLRVGWYVLKLCPHEFSGCPGTHNVCGLCMQVKVYSLWLRQN